MSQTPHKTPLRTFLAFALIAPSMNACSAQQTAEQTQPLTNEASTPLANAPVAYSIDAATGRSLFIEKGCVICHAANGVGGTAAHPFDRDRHDGAVDPLAFSARIWRGAPVMVELQAIELGYIIDLDAQEIADLAGFAASATEQEKLSINDVPENLRAWFLDDAIWEQDGWLDELRNRINSNRQ